MKIMDSRPSSLAKFFSSGSAQELGNTSSSEGEKDSPPPEWDSVPIHKEGSCKYQQVTDMQTFCIQNSWF